MKGKLFADEQTTYSPRQAEVGTPVADVCRHLGVSEAIELGQFPQWRVVRQEPGQRSVGTAPSHSRDRAREAALRLSAYTRHAATRELEGEPDARVSLVSLRGPANPHARASSQTHEPAS